MSSREDWTNPHQCPFCDEELASPGEGFVLHIGENPECESRFDRWRETISDDMRGGWSG